MAEDLARTPASGLAAQLCGDAHLSNFGGFGSPDRSLVFDLNDFDETLPGPWEWDVKRLAASMEIAGRNRGFGDRERRATVRSTVAAYREAMREFADLGHLQVWYSRMTSTDISARWGTAAGEKGRRKFDQLVQKAPQRDSERSSSRLTEVVDGRTRIASDPPLVVPLSDLAGDDDATSREFIKATLRSYRRSLSGAQRHLLEQFHYVDAARKVVGVGSVGTRSWIVLMHGADGQEPLFLQLKEAGESVLAPFAGKSRHDNAGQRVVEGQRLLQASSDIFLGWTRVSGLDGVVRDFYVRQLADWKVSADVENQSPATMTIYGQICGWTLARGHARSGDRIAIAAYLGGGDQFDVAIADFAAAYADQNEADFQRFVKDVKV